MRSSPVLARLSAAQAVFVTEARVEKHEGTQRSPVACDLPRRAWTRWTACSRSRGPSRATAASRWAAQAWGTCSCLRTSTSWAAACWHDHEAPVFGHHPTLNIMRAAWCSAVPVWPITNKRRRAGALMLCQAQPLKPVRRLADPSSLRHARAQWRREADQVGTKLAAAESK